MKTLLLLVVFAAIIATICAHRPPHRRRACSACFYRPRPQKSCRCGVILNRRGCPSGMCHSCRRHRRCSNIMCTLYCRGGFCHDRYTGCEVCYCRAPYWRNKY